ncbi:uncharacterized protein K02A2.6-like [Lucilia sericata]|uniref:uncharacterized protein K02A2.6-like n=1 Tax=Lucilia sericata TaxID=13632 RepID=UPI0018A80554|nr:uncharacterized protein K02A2.6-like [Lucilia sericata]
MTLQPWPIPSEPWQRLHIDYARPIEGQYFLVIVDALSKWPEIIATKTITTQQTIQILREVFARFGLPEIVVSDNGTQFKSSQFEEFMQQNGIKHICSSPYYPMSNGQADTFKRMLAKSTEEGTVCENLNTFLQNYRSTTNPNTPDKKSPAEVLLGRKMSITLDLLKPTKNNNRNVSVPHNKIAEQFNNKHGAKETNFDEQDAVYARIYKGNNNFCWSPD